MGVNVRYAADSSTGLVRVANEDAVYAGRRLYAVADGMGGHVAGEVASSTVIAALRAYDVEVASADLVETLSRAIREANNALRSKVEDNPELAGMGTTLTAMLWSGSHVALANIGDSRAYLLREGVLLQLTEDHTMAKLVADAGRLAPVISRYLDGRLDRSPDLTLRMSPVGDRYLLCSDGLSGVVSHVAIQEALQSAPSCSDAVRQLTDLAYNAGAPDNVSVLVLDITEIAAGNPAKPVALGAAVAAAEPVS
jgi:PPM family protein phosphatase